MMASSMAHATRSSIMRESVVLLTASSSGWRRHRRPDAHFPASSADTTARTQTRRTSVSPSAGSNRAIDQRRRNTARRTSAIVTGAPKASNASDHPSRSVDSASATDSARRGSLSGVRRRRTPTARRATLRASLAPARVRRRRDGRHGARITPAAARCDNAATAVTTSAEAIRTSISVKPESAWRRRDTPDDRAKPGPRAQRGPKSRITWKRQRSSLARVWSARNLPRRMRIDSAGTATCRRPPSTRAAHGREGLGGRRSSRQEPFECRSRGRLLRRRRCRLCRA